MNAKQRAAHERKVAAFLAKRKAQQPRKDLLSRRMYCPGCHEETQQTLSGHYLAGHYTSDGKPAVFARATCTCGFVRTVEFPANGLRPEDLPVEG